LCFWSRGHHRATVCFCEHLLLITELPRRRVTTVEDRRPDQQRERGDDDQSTTESTNDTNAASRISARAPTSGRAVTSA
jgi:hypothetical protein